MVVFTSSSLVRSVSSLRRGEHDDNKLTLNSYGSGGGGQQQCRNDASIGSSFTPPSSSSPYRILACSLSPLHSRLTLEELARFGDRELGSDRRGFLSQLHPKTFAGSVSVFLCVKELFCVVIDIAHKLFHLHKILNRLMIYHRCCRLILLIFCNPLLDF